MKIIPFIVRKIRIDAIIDIISRTTAACLSSVMLLGNSASTSYKTNTAMPISSLDKMTVGTLDPYYIKEIQ